MIKCKDCRFGGLKVLLDNESAPCLRVDNEECPNTVPLMKGVILYGYQNKTYTDDE